MLPLRTLGSAVIAIVVACAAAAGSPASASAASCSYPQASALFAPWQDFGAYTPFQGSGFENGASGWSWGNGAKIVGGDSNTLLGSWAHTRCRCPVAARPAAHGCASTPRRLRCGSSCAEYRAAGGLTIKGVVSSGTNKVTTLTTVSGASDTWQPSPVVVFPPFLTASATGINVQFQFTSDPGTVFHVDNVELDPYLRR